MLHPALYFATGGTYRLLIRKFDLFLCRLMANDQWVMGNFEFASGIKEPSHSK